MIVRQLIPSGYSDIACLRVARALMKTRPPLFYPIPYSEKSLKKNSLYNSSTEIYTLDEEVTNTQEYPQGVFTPITNCYVSTCRTGCYAPRCPNIGVAVDSQVRENSVAVRLTSNGKSYGSVNLTSLGTFLFADTDWYATTPHVYGVVYGIVHGHGTV